MKKMKYIAKIAALAAVVTLLSVSCGINPFIVIISADQTGETQIIVLNNTAKTRVSKFSYTGFSAGLTFAADQVLELEFAGGLIDAASALTGIVLYPLTDATADNPYNRGAALTIVGVEVLPDGGNNSIVRINLGDISTNTLISDNIELEIDPALATGALTADGGRSLLNQDGDNTPGEATQDVAIDYISVSGAPVAITAGTYERDPQATVTADGAGITGFTAASTQLDMTVSNSDGGTTLIDATSTASSFTVRRFDVDAETGAWSLSDNVVTDRTATAGNIAFAVPALADFQVYRVDWDNRSVTETAPVLGYTHFGTNNQNAAPSFAIYSVGSFQGFSGTPTVTGATHSEYVEVVFVGTEIDETTISTDSIRLYNTTKEIFVPKAMIASIVRTSLNTVRIALTQPFLAEFVGLSGSDAYVVVAYPTLRDNASTPGTAADDIAYGSTTGQFVPGIASASFSFGTP